MLSDEEEILDLVDEKDQVVGNITHAAAYDHAKLKGRFLRASNAFVVNSRGQLWIPRRQPHKKIAPNGLDFSMGEHVQSGESYIDGALRGFLEELSLKLLADDLVFLGTIGPEKGLAPYFTKNYIYYSDDEPDYNNEDFISAEWLTADEVIKKIKAGEKAKSSLLPTLELFLSQKAQRASD